MNVVVDGLFPPVMFLYGVHVGSDLIAYIVPKFFMKMYSIMVCDDYFQTSGAVTEEVDTFIILFFFTLFVLTL